MKNGALFALAVLAVSSGCQAFEFDLPPDQIPRSILVLPALNETNDITAPSQVLAKTAQLLSERGYYVYSPVVVYNFMQSQGLPTPGEMNQVPLGKLREVFGADAVLYMKILHWGPASLFSLFTRERLVKIEFCLMDARTGRELWRRTTAARDKKALTYLAGIALVRAFHPRRLPDGPRLRIEEP